MGTGRQASSCRQQDSLPHANVFLHPKLLPRQEHLRSPTAGSPGRSERTWHSLSFLCAAPSSQGSMGSHAVTPVWKAARHLRPVYKHLCQLGFPAPPGSSHTPLLTDCQWLPTAWTLRSKPSSTLHNSGSNKFSHSRSTVCVHVPGHAHFRSPTH